jgi:hypothetical protein
MSDYNPPKIGSALESADDEIIEVIGQCTIDRSHYAGMTEKEAYKVFEEECICRTCFQLPMCKIGSNGIENSLTAITRCLAYLPANQ